MQMNRSSAMRRTINALLLYSILISQSFGAIIEEKKDLKKNINLSSEYIFESYPNQELIPIRLIGSVKNSGLYHIPSNMKLTTLLALAGGTTPEADLENILIANDNNQKNESKNRKIDLEDILQNQNKTDSNLYPDDIVLVKNKTNIISNDSFRAASMASVILTTILTAIIIKDRTSK